MKLDGVRVIDMSQFLPGPYLSNIMADHGADVIKIEPPGGDPGRDIGLRENGISIFFRNMNRGKRSVCLDLKDPVQHRHLLRLCDESDVFIETSRPGVAKRLGVDFDALRARNPRIVYCSITAFGQTGPYAARPAHDLAVQATAGAVSVNLDKDDQPNIPCIPVADLSASLLALSGVLMALLRRERTGEGDYIDMSMHDAVLASFPNVLGTTFAQRRPPHCKTERTWGGAAFYQIYRTLDDRHIALGGQEHKFVRNLLTELGREDLIPVCDRGPGVHQKAVIDFFRQLFAQKSQAEWMAWFSGKDICYAAVKNLREAFDDPQARARDMVLIDAEGQEHVGLPIKFALEPGRARLSVPQLGEHNREVIGSWQSHRG
jgi:crotonobetainyl-CoA:carnitine CoA-transferase CaiB-like acyl-CoA transferase